MSEQQRSIFQRVAQWFGGSPEELPLARQAGPGSSNVPERRISFWRPWARRDAAIASLQQGFNSLSELMIAIRQHLEKQGLRQDQLLNYMAHLPEILETLPETQRMQAQTLQAIGQQLAQQLEHQEKLSDILQQMSQSTGQQQQILTSLNGQVQSLGENSQVISENLRQVGSAMQTMGRNSESSAQVLQQLSGEMTSRNAALERTLGRQNQRVVWMLVIAMILSVSALAAVCVVGWAILKRPMTTPIAAPVTPPPSTMPAANP